MLHLQQQLERVEADLSVFAAVFFTRGGEDLEASRRSARLAKQLDECRGVLHVVRDVRTWTAAICKVRAAPAAHSRAALPAALAPRGVSAGAMAALSESAARITMPHLGS
jgi:hypothetical protein